MVNLNERLLQLETRQGYCTNCASNRTFNIIRWKTCSTLLGEDLFSKTADDVTQVDDRTLLYPVLECTACGKRITGGYKDFRKK